MAVLWALCRGGSVYPTLARPNAKNASKPKPAWKYGIDPGGVNLEAATRFVSSTEAVPILVGILCSPTPQRKLVVR
jgi:hypothetical protein